MKRKRGGILLSLVAAVVLWLLLAVGRIGASLPDVFTVAPGESLDLSSMGLTVTETEEDQSVQVNYLGVIPVKTVTVTETEEQTVVVGGVPFGVKLFTDGVVVVGTSAISTDEGDQNPAEVAGVQVGDRILSVNDVPVSKTEQVGEAMADSGGAPVSLEVERDGEQLTLSVVPVRSSFDGQYKGGIWVRDSTAGIGMITYYCPETKTFGGLGHGICDVDTSDLLPLGVGEIVPVCISGVVKGESGAAGALQGYFSSDEVIGTLYQNGETGVYGTLSKGLTGETVSVARKQEITVGAAQIITTVDGEAPQKYDVVIESLDLRDDASVKNLVIRITDSRLLEKTGGIVQGMSGSPILQNGKLVGAVTHVFVSDPTRGYGIFAENMATRSALAVRE